MTPFTDDDIRRLTWNLKNSAPNWIDKDNLRGLLARLEAAERLIKEWIILDETLKDDKYVKAWRKACGAKHPLGS